MINGLKHENALFGSTFSDFVSGIDAQFSTATIASPTLTTASITTANVTTLAATNIKAGSHALSSGSRWVTFTTPFGNALYHVACTHFDATDGGVELVGAGSKAAGSFIAVGSTSASTAVFDWIAIPRQG